MTFILIIYYLAYMKKQIKSIVVHLQLKGFNILFLI